jgi:glycosidase
MRLAPPLILLGLLATVDPAIAGPDPTLPASVRDRPPEDEIVYFMLPDRFENGDPSNDQGGLEGDRYVTGFDPTSKAFYNGGDLKGLIDRVDYIQSLGATAIWLGPIYKNKPVQGVNPNTLTADTIMVAGVSGGYHGYWITDFTRVDPHFGGDADMRELVQALHARGMKIYLDIVTNHTADVIYYEECPDAACPYRSRGEFPYSTKGDASGTPINDGFLGVSSRNQTDENFARLTRPDYAYTPVVPDAEKTIKVPAWLNDPIYYNNRGNTTYSGESAQMGDFAGLDDLMTEHPRVRQGMIDIFGDWIDRYGVDGFRIDTAKYVDNGFWQAFLPAMRERAAARGIPQFFMFGEVSPEATYDTALMARYTRVAGLPTVLDFPLFYAIRDSVAGDAGPGVLARVFADDVLYEGGEDTALKLPTFISNHDNGRFAHVVYDKRPEVGPEEALQRTALAHAMLLTLRGVPTLYYGDEQGFAGRGGDQWARQSLFPSRVAEFNEEPLVGTDATTADSNFDTTHPLYRLVAELSALRSGHAALRRGRQVQRTYSDKEPGLFSVSRFDPDTGREYVMAYNTSTVPLVTQVEVEAHSRGFESLHGSCQQAVTAPGSLRVELPPLGFIVCAATSP